MTERHFFSTEKSPEKDEFPVLEGVVLQKNWLARKKEASGKKKKGKKNPRRRKLGARSCAADREGKYILRLPSRERLALRKGLSRKAPTVSRQMVPSPEEKGGKKTYSGETGVPSRL